MRTLASFAVFASVLALAAPAAASETVIDTPARGSVLAARGRTLAYSAYDVASKSYRLRIKVGMSAPRDLGVPPRSVPFDVSVARGSIPRGGHSDVLLYSRCRQEPSGLVGGLPYLRWTTARDCSLWVAGLGGRERRIVGPPSDAVLPSLSGATLAFARVPRSGRSSIVVRHIGSHAAQWRQLLRTDVDRRRLAALDRDLFRRPGGLSSSTQLRQPFAHGGASRSPQPRCGSAPTRRRPARHGPCVTARRSTSSQTRCPPSASWCRRPRRRSSCAEPDVDRRRLSCPGTRTEHSGRTVTRRGPV